jgi:LPXTG-motif cell wall-anchored protein
MYKKLTVFLFLAAAFLLSAPSALAVKFDLVPPSGQLSRGQEVTFTINIDPQGATITNIQTGMTYETQYLEYVSAAAGAAMNSLSVDTSQGTGKLVFTGSNTAGLTTTGVFATVTFKIIAEQSGETELCSLWAVTPTNTPPPVVPTTPPAQPTSPPPPTALPETGFDIPKNTGAIAGAAFLLVAGAVFFYTRQNAYMTHEVHRKKTPHHPVKK